LVLQKKKWPDALIIKEFEKENEKKEIDLKYWLSVN